MFGLTMITMLWQKSGKAYCQRWRWQSMWVYLEFKKGLIENMALKRKPKQSRKGRCEAVWERTISRTENNKCKTPEVSIWLRWFKDRELGEELQKWSLRELEHKQRRFWWEQRCFFHCSSFDGENMETTLSDYFYFFSKIWHQAIRWGTG